MNMKPIPYEGKDMSNFVEDPFQARRDYFCQSVADFSLNDTKTLKKFTQIKLDETKRIDCLITEISNGHKDSTIVNDT